MKKSIYNIQADYLKVVEDIIDQEGEVTEEQEKYLAITKEDLQVKATNYALVVLETDRIMESIDKEMERLVKLGMYYGKLNVKLKNMLHSAMETFNLDKIESDIVKISFRQSESVEIENEDNLPAECFKTSRIVSKTKIKELIKSGQPISGAKIVKKNNLQIK